MRRRKNKTERELPIFSKSKEWEFHVARFYGDGGERESAREEKEKYNFAGAVKKSAYTQADTVYAYNIYILVLLEIEFIIL